MVGVFEVVRNGVIQRVSRRTLEDLRMQMDWQLAQAGYEPMSINVACRIADGEA